LADVCHLYPDATIAVRPADDAGRIVVSLHGRLRGHGAETARAALTDAAHRRGCRLFIVDVAAAEVCDPAGMAALLQARRAAIAVRAGFVLTAATPRLGTDIDAAGTSAFLGWPPTTDVPSQTAMRSGDDGGQPAPARWPDPHRPLIQSSTAGGCPTRSGPPPPGRPAK
jgi:anti-anti-sigma factor